MSQKQSLIQTYEQEHPTTLRVLRAFPAGKEDLRPHPKLKTARELAWMFVIECDLGIRVLKRDFPGTGGQLQMPDTMAQIIAKFEEMHREYMKLLASYSEEELKENIKFFTGPKQMGDMPRVAFAWFLLHDQIHHRGQFSIYLRLADAKVPSIYGPTADEPWN